MPLVVKHVLKHPSGRCDYRRPFPAKLAPFVDWPSPQFKKSLGREDEKGFGARYEAAGDQYHALKTQAEKRQAGAFDKLDGPTIAYLAAAYYSRRMTKDDQARWHPKNWGGAFGSMIFDRSQREKWAHLQRGAVLSARSKHVALRAGADVQGLLDTWTALAIGLAGECGCLVDPSDTEGLIALCRAINDAAIRAADDQLALEAGKNVAIPAAPERPRADRAVAIPERVPLLSTYETYALDVGMTKRSREEGRSYIRALVEYLGHDDAARVTSKDVGAWRDSLLIAPTKLGGKRSPVTVNDKYLGTLKAMLGWASKKGRKLLPENVAAGVRAAVPKRRKLRERHFSQDEAEKILTASLIPAPPRMSEGNRRARRWVPWLCAYTGARVGEMAQLRGIDVREVDGIWTLRITPEAGTVKDREYRIVPLHPHVIEQGFLAVVKAVGEGPIFYDPALKRKDNEDTRHIDKVGEKLAAWVRNEVGVTDREVKPNHAWRNLFKTVALELDIIPRVSDAITGHALPRGEVGRTYEGPFLQTMAKAVQRFPRFVVPGMGA